MGTVRARQPPSQHQPSLNMMVSNKCLVMILVSCLLLSLVLPAIEAAKTRRTKSGVRRNRARIANSRKAQARALRARQIARRRGKTGTDYADYEEYDAAASDVVEDDASTPSVDGMGDICEAVMFNKDGEAIMFQFTKNDC